MGDTDTDLVFGWIVLSFVSVRVNVCLATTLCETTRISNGNGLGDIVSALISPYRTVIEPSLNGMS